MSEGPDKGKSVLHILKEKHPRSGPPHLDALVVQPSDGVSDFHPIIFDAASILSAALHTTGAAGPSGADAMWWYRFCSTYGQKSIYLCRTIADFVKKICTVYLDPQTIDAYTVCRLIPVDKILALVP